MLTVFLVGILLEALAWRFVLFEISLRRGNCNLSVIPNAEFRERRETRPDYCHSYSSCLLKFLENATWSWAGVGVSRWTKSFWVAVTLCRSAEAFTVQSLYGNYTLRAASRIQQWVTGTALLFISTFLFLSNITVATVMIKVRFYALLLQ